MKLSVIVFLDLYDFNGNRNGLKCVEIVLKYVKMGILLNYRGNKMFILCIYFLYIGEIWY